MAYNLLSSDSTSQWLANTSGDTYVLKEGVYLGVVGTAISGTAAVLNRKFQIDGHVTGEGGGSGMFIGADADSGGSTTIQISQTGSVFGEAYGVVAYGGDLQLVNQGSLTGSTAGLFMDGVHNAVTNQATILSYGGTGINSQGGNAFIDNHGSIAGVTCGVLLAESGSTLINHGQISSSDTAFSTTGVNMTAGNCDFFNYGTVSTEGGRVVLGGDDSQSVVNMGTIHGYVALGGGSDYFNNDGGTVFGIIDLGAGDDTFSSNDGTGLSSITGASGDDAYFMYDVSTEIMEHNAGGNDTVSAFVSYLLAENFENLILKGSGNLSATGNGLANRLLGNDGANKLLGLGGNDSLYGSVGNDRYDGGSGIDTLFYADEFSDKTLPGGVTVNLATGKGGGAATGHTFVGIENVVGTETKDQIVGNAAANKLNGLYGNDTLTGGGGKDLFVFIGGGGRDIITDFKDKVDRITLDVHVNGFDANAFSDLGGLISQKGKDVVIDFSSINAGDILSIRHADIADFSAADFEFL